VVSITAAAESFLPYQFAALTKQPDQRHIIILFGMVLLCSILIVIKKYICDVTNEVVLLSLRAFCFSRFLQNDMRFFQKKKTAQLLSIIISDVKAVRATITKTIFKLCKQLSSFISMTILMITLNYKLTFVLLSNDHTI
jgi:ABC-type multidrug transport system fused ATPase/permease subunit